MRTRKAKSLSEAFRAAQELIAEWPDGEQTYCWFRGSNDRALALQPGACWRENYNELDVLIPFSQEGVMFADVGSIDSWDTYYLAQHHRIPTRLLDWTESFSAALFFAFDGWNGRTEPCIWVMRPDAFNEAALKWKGVLTPENNPELDAWLPRRVKSATTHTTLDGYTYDNTLPLALYPKRGNGRLSAQQGMFTVHGSTSHPLQTILDGLSVPRESVLGRIDLDGFVIDSVFSQLRLLGIRRSAVYPDIDNFVLDLKEQLGWQ